MDPSKAYIFMFKKTGNALALSMADDRPFMLYTATAGSKGALGRYRYLTSNTATTDAAIHPFRWFGIQESACQH